MFSSFLNFLILTKKHVSADFLHFLVVAVVSVVGIISSSIVFVDNSVVDCSDNVDRLLEYGIKMLFEWKFQTRNVIPTPISNNMKIINGNHLLSLDHFEFSIPVLLFSTISFIDLTALFFKGCFSVFSSTSMVSEIFFSLSLSSVLNSVYLNGFLTRPSLAKPRSSNW